MKKYKLHKLIFLFLMSLIILSGCGKNTEKDDFNFSFEYNVNGDDMISTYDNTFRVNTVEGVKTINLRLSDSDKIKVKEFLVNNDLINKEFSLAGKKLVREEPCEYCTLKYTYNGVENEIGWSSNEIASLLSELSDDTKSENIEEDEKFKENREIAMKLVEFEKLIEDIVYSYDEVKKLPQHVLYE